MEIPKGDTFPVSVPFFGLNLKPLDFETLGHGGASSNVAVNNPHPDHDRGQEAAVLQEFPDLHDFHIQHRRTHGAGQVEEVEARELLSEPRLPAEYVIRGHSSRLKGISHKGMDLSNFPLMDNDFSQLEKLEEIRFESVPKTAAPSGSPTTTTTDGAAGSQFSDLPFSPYQQFNPTMKRVVMTHDDLMSTIKNMVQNQENNIELEKRFLEALVNEEN